jgi:hypothetical protein
LIAEKTWCAGDDAPALLVDVIHDGLPSFDLVVRPRHSVEGFRHRAGVDPFGDEKPRAGP